MSPISGEVFIKKCEALSNSVAGGISKQAMVQSTSVGEGRQKIMPLIEIPDKVMAIDSKRTDWISDWMVAKPSSTMEHPLRKGSGAFTGRNTATVIKQENIDSSDGPPLSLDLDLRLTSDSRSRLACEALDVPSWRSRHSVSAPSAPVGQDSYYNQTQSWKLQSAAQDTGRLTSIQEMVSETTMATAVCSKCLMYVLLKKTNPTCPRCFNPIILDCCGKGSSVKKRARLELSPDDFSLSTDSSR
ncbi:hypothetical protein KP509_21G076900 [Ceratopteris richardii]|uniref:Uncharacterized protein n=1 Tax=Ceratopteris richardii TaxID=49495 RepID=A0A8T2SBI6_CERRI|nr:hypothetical protein KP509_21G076900 [Ceratopteris richardii]